MTQIVFTALVATLIALSGQPAKAALGDNLCRAAIMDAALYAGGPDALRALRRTDYDWDTAHPGVASAISQAYLTYLWDGRSETLDIGVTEERIVPLLPQLNRHRSITLSDGRNVYVSYLFCRSSRREGRLYEIGLAYSRYPGGRVTGEVSAYVSSDLRRLLQQGYARAPSLRGRR